MDTQVSRQEHVRKHTHKILFVALVSYLLNFPIQTFVFGIGGEFWSPTHVEAVTTPPPAISSERYPVMLLGIFVFFILVSIYQVGIRYILIEAILDNHAPILAMFLRPMLHVMLFLLVGVAWSATYILFFPQDIDMAKIIVRSQVFFWLILFLVSGAFNIFLVLGAWRLKSLPLNIIIPIILWSLLQMILAVLAADYNNGLWVYNPYSIPAGVNLLIFTMYFYLLSRAKDHGEHETTVSM